MKILIADDESLARERLARLIQNLSGYQLTPEPATNGMQVLELVERYQPDIVLLDIRMPLMDGLQVAARLSNLATPPAIIFCTAHDEFAIQAFNVSAVGYLVKPVRTEQLEKCLANASKINRIQLSQLTKSNNEPNNYGKRSHLTARTHRGLELIPVNTIVCLQADHKYVTLKHLEGETLIDDSLKTLEEEFPELFIRIHRNALVNRHYIDGLQRNNLGQVLIRLQNLEEALVVSRRHVPAIRKLMEQL